MAEKDFQIENKESNESWEDRKQKVIKSEVIEKDIEVLRRMWNEVLFDCLRTKEKYLNKTINDISFEEAPFALEKITLENSSDKKTPLIILTAPSASGKGTYGKEFEKQGIERLPRTLTRPQRPGEVNGKDYCFIDKEEFMKKVEDDEMIWYHLADEKVLNYHRGIEKQVISQLEAEGKKVYIDAGRGTAMEFTQKPAVKDINPLMVFLLPKDFKVLYDRLIKRREQEIAQLEKLKESIQGTTKDVMTIQEVYQRLNLAIGHLADTKNLVDIYIVNDKLEEVPEKVKRILLKII